MAVIAIERASLPRIEWARRSVSDSSKRLKRGSNAAATDSMQSRLTILVAYCTQPEERREERRREGWSSGEREAHNLMI
jgi:hypothetical protein